MAAHQAELNGGWVRLARLVSARTVASNCIAAKSEDVKDQALLGGRPASCVVEKQTLIAPGPAGRRVHSVYSGPAGEIDPSVFPFSPLLAQRHSRRARS